MTTGTKQYLLLQEVDPSAFRVGKHNNTPYLLQLSSTHPLSALVIITTRPKFIESFNAASEMRAEEKMCKNCFHAGDAG